MYPKLTQEMQQYYHNMYPSDKNPSALYQKYQNLLHESCERTKAFHQSNPDAPYAVLKSHLHGVVADLFEPVIFPHCPFFYEMGLKIPIDWGAHGTSPGAVFRWYLYDIRQKDSVLFKHLSKKFNDKFLYLSPDTFGIFSIDQPFDHDHHTLGYTKLFAVGINGLQEEIVESMQKFRKDTEEYVYLSAMQDSLNAVLKIAEKFALKAESMLLTCDDPDVRSNLEKIAKAARNVPACPPSSFYEGLCMLLFTREVTATLDGDGISQFGQVDKLLHPLYQKDIDTGTLTEAEARDYIGRWMLFTDIKFKMKEQSWPETSTCMELGGCDAEGNPVYNHVTRMFIEEHQKMKLINPKLNCRYSKASPDEYLQLIGEAVISGDNNYALSCDDVLIPALTRSNVDIKDARGYVNGGCQETMIEGCGHTEGAYLYVSIMKIFELFLTPQRDSADLIPPAMQEYDSFEDFRKAFADAFCHCVNFAVDYKKYKLHVLKDVFAAPFLSATQAGCIETGTDYVNGGAKYNFSTICLTGTANIADSLYAVKHFVFDKKLLTLSELRNILAANWEGYTDLRQIALHLPKYGTGNPEVDGLAASFFDTIVPRLTQIKTLRGGNCLVSLFVYYYYKYFGDYVGATPDGRKQKDLLSPGISPSQQATIGNCVAPLDTFQNMDFTILGGGNAVFDVTFPLSKNITKEVFAAFIRTCGESGVPTVQPNVYSVEDLKEAQTHPELHQNLIVRICGLSAYFVALDKGTQDEIISRYVYNP